MKIIMNTGIVSAEKQMVIIFNIITSHDVFCNSDDCVLKYIIPSAAFRNTF